MCCNTFTCMVVRWIKTKIVFYRSSTKDNIIIILSKTAGARSKSSNITAPFNNMRTLVDSNIQSSTDTCIFRCRQSNVRRLLPASGYCRACGNQIVYHSSDNETVLGSSRKLGGAAEHLIDGSEKPICRLSFEF